MNIIATMYAAPFKLTLALEAHSDFGEEMCWTISLERDKHSGRGLELIASTETWSEAQVLAQWAEACSHFTGNAIAWNARDVTDDLASSQTAQPTAN